MPVLTICCFCGSLSLWLFSLGSLLFGSVSGIMHPNDASLYVIAVTLTLNAKTETAKNLNNIVNLQ